MDTAMLLPWSDQDRKLCSITMFPFSPEARKFFMRLCCCRPSVSNCGTSCTISYLPSIPIVCSVAAKYPTIAHFTPEDLEVRWAVSTKHHFRGPSFAAVSVAMAMLLNLFFSDMFIILPVVPFPVRSIFVRTFAVTHLVCL